MLPFAAFGQEKDSLQATNKPVSAKESAKERRQKMKDAVYLDEYGSRTLEGLATFYTLKEDETRENGVVTWIEKTYTMKGVLTTSCKMAYSRDAYLASVQQAGPEYTFYPNGTKKGNTFQDGHFETYYENGSIKERGQTINDTEKHIFQYLDKDGKDLLINGTGVFYDHSKKYNARIYHEVKDSVLVGSYLIDPEQKDTLYTYTGTTQEPRNGWVMYHKAIHNYHGTNYVLPQYISGNRLYVRFVVDENGSVGRVSNINSLNYYVDRDIVNSVRLAGSFNKPTLKNGKPVKVLMISTVHWSRPDGM